MCFVLYVAPGVFFTIFIFSFTDLKIFNANSLETLEILNLLRSFRTLLSTVFVLYMTSKLIQFNFILLREKLNLQTSQVGYNSRSLEIIKMAQRKRNHLKGKIKRRTKIKMQIQMKVIVVHQNRKRLLVLPLRCLTQFLNCHS